MNLIYLSCVLCGLELEYQTEELDLNFPVEILRKKLVDHHLVGNYDVFVLYPPDEKFINIVTRGIKFIYELNEEATCIVDTKSLLYRNLRRQCLFRVIIQDTAGGERLFISDLLYLKNDNTIFFFEHRTHVKFVLYVQYLINKCRDKLNSYIKTASEVQNIKNAMYEISKKAHGKDLEEWKEFLNNLDALDYSAEGWSEHLDMIRVSLKWLKGNFKELSAYKEFVRRFTSRKSTYLEEIKFENISETICEEETTRL